MALEHISRLVNQGHIWAVKLDIVQCFESINLCRLQRVIARRIKDRSLRKLIHSWLILTPVQRDHTGASRQGEIKRLLQGSPLSPLLANIYLDQFDKLARRKRQNIVRYADDIIILCRTHAEAKKALRQAKRILASLDLALNSHKTHILHVEEGLSFLGATLEFQAGEDGSSGWIPVFPEIIEEPELDETTETHFVSEDLEALLEEVNKHPNGHPVRR
jgi:retron-type reverse transcriptase